MATFEDSTPSHKPVKAPKSSWKYITIFSILLSILTVYFLVVPNLPTSYKRFRNIYRRVLQSSGDVSLPENSFTISDSFTVNYDLNLNASTITMAIKFNTPNQYFAFG